MMVMPPVLPHERWMKGQLHAVSQQGPFNQGRASTPPPHCSLTRISMVPLEIFVVMPKAWKKEVFSGPRPVFWAGTVTSQGAIAPARAAAGTWRKKKQGKSKEPFSLGSPVIASTPSQNDPACQTSPRHTPTRQQWKSYSATAAGA